MSIHVLVIEPDPEEVLLLQEVLAELDGGPYWSQWTHLEFVVAMNWRQAEELLARRDAITPIDLALVELDLPDSPAGQTFSRFQTIASEIPMVLLSSPEDLPAAERRLQEGAQDVLLKSELDCLPLAGAIRRAMKRQRLLSATRALTSHDPDTGLLTRTAFLAALERDRELVKLKGGRILLALMEPYGGSVESSDRALERNSGPGIDSLGFDLLEEVEALRMSAGPLDLIGRLGEARLGLGILEKDLGDLELRREHLREVARSARMGLGSAVFDMARPVSIDGLLKLAEADLAPRTQAVAMVR